MGWETSLTIGSFIESWRKQAPNLPALLFTLEDFSFIEDRDEDGKESKRAHFRSTVERCISNVDNLGYSWDFLVRFYGESRHSTGDYVLGLLEGSLIVSKISEKKYHRISKRFENLTPEQDLLALVKYYRQVLAQSKKVSTWELPGGEEESQRHEIIQKMLPFGEVATTGSADLEIYAATRAADFLGWLRFMIRDLGWILFIRILLSAFDSKEKVELDLSEYLEEMLATEEIFGDQSEDILSTFGLDYLEGAIAGLSNHAQLMGRMYSVLAEARNDLSRHFFAERALNLLRLLDSKIGTRQERGKYLEDMAEALISMEPQLRVLQKNLSNDTEELDLVLSNQMDNPFWISMQSPVIFVECKNWSTAVGASEARVFDSKLRERGNLCRIGIFIALSGVTKPFSKIAIDIQSQGHILFIVTGEDIREMLSRRMSLSEWLLEYGTTKII